MPTVKIDYQHILLVLAIVLPVVAQSLAGQFAAGSVGAIVVVVLGAVGLALKPSVSTTATLNAADKLSAEQVLK